LKRENINPDKLGSLVATQVKNFEAMPDLYHDKGVHQGKMKTKYQTAKKKIERNKALVDVYREYEALLTKRSIYDFGDMIMEVIKSLETNNDFLLQVEEEYQYILADEHQDANGAQNRLLELLSSFHDNPNLFIVGDEKQAIYQFQGASLDNFNYFKQLYPQVKVVGLTNNYRSVKPVLDSAHSLISHSQVLTQDKLIPLKAVERSLNQKPSLWLSNFTDEEYELRFVAEKIKNLITAGTSPAEIAVLYRNNKDAQKIGPFLDQAGVAYSIESDENILQDVDIIKFLSLLRALTDLNNKRELLKIIHFSFFNLPRLDVYKVINELKINDLSLGDFIMPAAAEKIVSDITPWRQFWTKIESWNTLAYNDLLNPVLKQVINESGFLDYILTKPEAVVKINKLRRLLDEVSVVIDSKPEATVGDFLRHVDTLLDHGLALETKTGVNVSTGVRLMTAHKAKGLEFDQVFIVGVRDGHWGNKRSVTYFSTPERGQLAEHDKIDDERRLFYVALTRARFGVHISLARKSRASADFLPSQFLSEIDQNLLEIIDTSKVEEKYAADPSFVLKSYPSSNEESLNNKEYLQQLFKQQGLSVTALNNYLDCPWKYFFRNLIRLPETKSKHLLYGTAVHDALEKFFNLYKADQKLPPKKILLKFFNQALNNTPLSASDLKEVKERGEVALAGYYDTYNLSWTSNVITEYKVTIPNIQREVFITGKLDKLELLNGGQSVNVVDYKTGGVRSRNDIEGKTKTSTGNIKRQLAFYKLLLDKDEEQKFVLESAEVDFIEPNNRGVYKKEKFILELNEIEELEQIVVETIDSILDLTFWNKQCDDKNCEFCQLKQVLN
ncbi:MAG: ATP-dependent DNA helicase, partial [Candidatus Paceibacterota bacterium]